MSTLIWDKGILTSSPNTNPYDHFSVLISLPGISFPGLILIKSHHLKMVTVVILQERHGRLIESKVAFSHHWLEFLLGVGGLRTIVS